MKTSWNITFLMLLLSPTIFAQLTISTNDISSAPGTAIATNGNINLGSRERTYGQASWHLVGAENQQISGSTNPTAFYNLIINGGGTKIFSGAFGIVNELHLINGLVSIPAGERFALNSPAVLQDGYGSQSYIDGMLLIDIENNNSATYPVGTNGTYTPIALSNIAGTSPVIGITAHKSGIGTLGDMPEQVDDYSKNWNWELSLLSADNTFNAANITIPFLDEDKSQFDGEDYKPLVLYQNPAGITSNLNNASNVASMTDPDITSAELGGKGFYFAGKTLLNTPIVHNVITPNGDSANDFLVIENLNFFPENQIQIVDRYGVEIFTRTNYKSPTADSAEGEDFTFLPPGNYICILKFNNGKNTIKQTISVIR